VISKLPFKIKTNHQYSIGHGSAGLGSQILHCFFDIKDLIEKRRLKYVQTYGLVPKFKAGLHLGTAAVGEVGSIKRDIVFSGDVLNTTSRIEETCRQFAARILASGALLDQIPDLDEFDLQSIGSITLKGKQQKIILFAVERNGVERIGDKKPVYLACVHANVEDVAQDLLKRVADVVKPKKTVITGLSPAVGTHTGPGTIGLAWMAGYE